MATPLGGPPVQDIAPKGGYPQVSEKTSLILRSLTQARPVITTWMGDILLLAILCDRFTTWKGSDRVDRRAGRSGVAPFW